MKKRFFAFLLAVVMVVGVMPPSAAAKIVKSGQCGANASWAEDDNGLLTISGTGPMRNYDVIMNWSPWHMGSASAIKIEEGITTIGSAAFGWMFSLKTVEIPKSVIAIGSDAFNNSRMITDIYYAGTEEDWNNILISSGNYTLDGANIHYGSYGNGGSGALSGTCGAQLDWSLSSDGTLTIRGTGEMDDFTGGGEGTAPWYAYRKNIKAVIIEDGVTSTGYCAFWDHTNMETIELPNTLIKIGGFSLALCTSLKEVNIPASVKQIDFSAFAACYEFTSITVPDSITKIEGQTFSECTGLKEITVPGGITSIGDTAFWKCPNLSDVYFGGNEQEWQKVTVGKDNDPLLRANVHCTGTGGKTQPEYDIYCGGEPIKFDLSLEECLSQKPSTQYNPELAHMLIAMCNSVYVIDDMAATLKSFGLSWGNKSPIISKKYITYSVSKQYMEDGTPLVLVVVKGTGDLPLPWPLSKNPDWDGWGSNAWGYADISNGLHSGYRDSAEEVYRDIKEILKNDTEDLTKVKFALTGFSRGAATANLLAVKLIANEKVSQDNIYAYTFACPDVTIRSDPPRYGCIFNIADAADFVSWTPSGAFDGDGIFEGDYSAWNTFGNSYWFSEDWNDPNLVMNTKAHNQYSYLLFLGKKLDISNYRKREEAKRYLDDAAERRTREERERLQEALRNRPHTSSRGSVPRARVKCPVDVKVYSAGGELLGSIINNEVKTASSEKIFLYVSGNEKHIYFFGDEQYDVRISGTDTGSMTYTLEYLDVGAWETSDEQTISQVEITKGKQFSSKVEVKDGTTEALTDRTVKLYVLDSSGQPEKEVLPDGKGTEVAYVPKPAAKLKFTDVPAGTYYFDAVQWAVENSITAGTTAATFSPDAPCTRAQIVTFLWRSAGSPAPKNSINPFTDVKPGTYYYDAVLWAVSQGITAGTTATTFSPDAVCTRAQAVTFLYRAAGSPTVAGNSPFTDVVSGAYYDGAVRWAVSKGVTAGTSATTFSPDQNCTRAQIVTFLYRDRTGKK